MLVVALPMHHWESHSNFAEEAPTNAKEQLGLDMLAQCAMGKGGKGLLQLFARSQGHQKVFGSFCAFRFAAEAPQEHGHAWT